jgi:hypothetical protein
MKRHYAVRHIASRYPHVPANDIEARLRYSTFVNFDRRYLYFEVPKAACTWMKTLIHRLEDLPPIPILDIDSGPEVRREMFIHSRDKFNMPSLLDFDDEQQQEVLHSPDFLRLAIVRNPYTRLESAWRDKVRLCAPGYAWLYHRIKGGLPEAGKPESFISLKEFVAAISETDVRVSNNHWRLQAEHTFSDAIEFNLIGNVESLDRVIPVFMRHADYALDRMPAPINTTVGFSDAFDEAVAQRIYALYRQDFTKFGYPEDSWPRTRQSSETSTVSETRFTNEILERNIILGQLYASRTELRKKLTISSDTASDARYRVYRQSGFETIFERFLSPIDGRLSHDEARHLYGLAKRAQAGCIVAIGSYRGRSTAALAFGTIAGAGLPVFAIDPHEPSIGADGRKCGPDDRGHFMRTMVELGLYHQVRLINLSSANLGKVWPLPVRLLWIDGGHRYRSVKRDFRCWRNKLSSDADIVFDAVTDPAAGPGRLVQELAENGRYRIVARIGATATLRAV